MNLKTTGIDHLNLAVKDLEESVTFYRDLFGWETLKEQPEQNSKIIGDASTKLCLYETDDMDNYSPQGFYHFGINIENFDEAIGKCEEMGIEIQYGEAVEWEKSRSIYIKDPNGYEIELTSVFGGGL
ncbi:MAG: VOC family protein [Bacteroidetes bacterium]|nr:VOC family protein [Bacteroidota bacterium]